MALVYLDLKTDWTLRTFRISMLRRSLNMALCWCNCYIYEFMNIFSMNLLVKTSEISPTVLLEVSGAQFRAVGWEYKPININLRMIEQIWHLDKWLWTLGRCWSRSKTGLEWIREKSSKNVIFHILKKVSKIWRNMMSLSPSYFVTNV